MVVGESICMNVYVCVCAQDESRGPSDESEQWPGSRQHSTLASSRQMILDVERLEMYVDVLHVERSVGHALHVLKTRGYLDSYKQDRISPVPGG